MTSTSTHHTPDRAALDGNALAGVLLDTLGVDLSAARGRCGGCHALDLIASTVVTMTAMGAVARCRSCDHVLITVVRAGDRSWVGLAGLHALEI